jgi:hypothetical protein
MILAVALFGSTAWAQGASGNEQLVQSFRALLSSGTDTQAVIQAVADAVKEALKQGPMAPAQAQAALAGSPAAAPAAGAPAVAPPKIWADAITVKGDVRYRTETRQDRGANKATDPNANVEYDRIRARLGMEAKLNDNVKAVVRLTTDGTGTGGAGLGGDPQSGNQDLNNGASKKPIFLDLAYIDWNLFGEGADELHVLGGKMANPFSLMNDDLVWDPDTTPEGVALRGQLDLSPVTLFGSAGYFILNNRNAVTNADNQVALYGLQGAARVEFVPEVALTLGASWYDYYNIKGSLVSAYDVLGKAKSTSFYGNTLQGGKMVNDYEVFQPFAQLDLYPTLFGSVVPISVFAQCAENVAADRNSSGYMYGVSVGKAKNPQTWEFGASYARLEKDAVLGMWTDSDRWGGGTDGSGYKLYGKYMILKNLMGGITYFNDLKGLSGVSHGKEYDRWQFDLTASF